MKNFRKIAVLVVLALIILTSTFLVWRSRKAAQIAKSALAEKKQTLIPAAIKPKLVVGAGHSSSITSMAFSSDGRLLASGSTDHTVKLWSANTGILLRTLTGHLDQVKTVAFSPDSKTLLSAGSDETIRLWNVITGKELQIFSSSDKTSLKVGDSAAFSPDGKILASWGVLGFNIKLIDIPSGKQIGATKRQGDFIRAVAFDPSGRIIASGSSTFAGNCQDCSIKLMDVKTGNELRTFTNRSNNINSLVFSPDGKRLASGSDDRTIKLWDTLTGGKIHAFVGHTDYIFSVCYSSDGKFLVSSSRDRTIKFWDAVTRKEKRTLKEHTSGAFSLTLSPDNKVLASGGFDGAIKLWDVASGAELRTLEGYAGIGSAALSSDGRILASGSRDGSVNLWDATVGTELLTLKGHNKKVCAVAFSSDSKTLASGSEDGTIKLWNTGTGLELHTLDYNRKTPNTFHSEVGYVRYLAFTSDDKTLVSMDFVETVKTWDVRTGKKLRTLTKRDFDFASAAIHSDGKTIAMGEFDGPVRLLDIATGSPLRTFTGHKGVVDLLAFSSDSKYLASWSSPFGDSSLKLWDTITKKEILTLTTFDESTADSVSQLSYLIFGPADRTLLVGNDGGTIKLLDITNAINGSTDKVVNYLSDIESHTFFGHTGKILSLSFNYDRKTLVSGSEDGTIKLWDITTGIELASLVLLGDGGWALVTPDGRFDTNRIDDIKGLHWAMPDAPLTPLPIELFMRDYYEPKLLARVLAREKLKPVRDISTLNRTQPEVKIVEIATDSTETSQVTVEVANIKSGEQQDTAGKPLESGVFDVRLFRNGQLVGYAPENDGEVKLNAEGKATLKFSNIKLPRTGVEQVEFSAYAFNADRVKSATDRKTYQLTPKPAPVKGRAYLIRLGVNAAEREGLHLRYAANDARQANDLAARLAARGEYQEVVSLPLISDYTVTLADGRTLAAHDATVEEVRAGRKRVTENTATKAHLRAVLDVLAGRQGDAALLKQIPNADKLRAARPEDLVLISASSHGYTDSDGIFYLVPSDSGTAVLKSPEFRRRCVSSDELSRWLRDVDAGELVLIVDACHSAAAIEGTDFKPGPMGSRGLGQLSYDKGMRILTATQADNVALEKGGLGLLMRALLVDGLTAWQADYKPRDQAILLTEWLTFGVERVPRLYEEMRDGRMRGTFDPRELAEGKTQQPALFDFARRRREVVLARQP